MSSRFDRYSSLGALPPTTLAPPRRWHLAVAALGYLILAVYGSLVPLTYQPLEWNDALERFANIRYLNLGIESRSDWVANILLFVPLAWLTMGALCVDRSLLWSACWALVVAAACHALSWSIEFVQLFFPPRTVSVNDVVAETIGGAIGTVLWVTVGQAVTNWCRRVWAHSRANNSLAMLLLPGYLLALIVIHIMPLDLTISPVEVYHKFKEGKVLPVPFTQVGRGWEFVQGTIWNMVYFAPLGWLIASLRRPDGSWRFELSTVAVIGLLSTAAIEGMQLFVYTRYSDTTDIITGSLAVSVAAIATRLAMPARHLSQAAPSVIVLPGPIAAAGYVSRPRQRPVGLSTVVGWLLPLAWCAALAMLNWWPFNFTTAPLPEANGVPLAIWRARRMSWLPFENYYWQSEFASFDQVLQKGISFAVLGVLLTIGWRLRWGWLVFVLAVLVAGSLEFGQLFLVKRYPDVTDVLIEGIGAWCGFAICHRWQRTQLLSVATAK
jgi:glycopeptide antibiotics resistance protein